MDAYENALLNDWKILASLPKFTQEQAQTQTCSSVLQLLYGYINFDEDTSLSVKQLTEFVSFRSTSGDNLLLLVAFFGNIDAWDAMRIAQHHGKIEMVKHIREKGGEGEEHPLINSVKQSSPRSWYKWIFDTYTCTKEHSE